MEQAVIASICTGLYMGILVVVAMHFYKKLDSKIERHKEYYQEYYEGQETWFKLNHKLRCKEMQELQLRELSELVKKTDIVSCDVCGCLILKKDAFKGSSTVSYISFAYGLDYESAMLRNPPGERIIEHYFCKTHKPKKKAK